MSDKLETIQTLGKALENYREELVDRTEAMEQLLGKIKSIEEDALPSLMEQLGLSEITLSNGSVIKLHKQIQGKIKDEGTCMRWLHQNGHEAIVKNEYKVNLRAGEDTDPVEQALRESGVAFSNKMTVHHSTLNKFLRERLEAGDDLPMEAFGVYETKLVKFKNVTE